MNRGRTFWRILTLLLLPVTAMAIVSIFLYQASVTNSRAAFIQEMETLLTGVSEQNESTVREIIALSEVIRRDPRVIEFYENVYENQIPERMFADLQDLLLLYRSWNTKLTSIVLFGSRDGPVLVSDGTYAHEELSWVFAQESVAAKASSVEARAIRLPSGIQMVFDSYSGKIVFVRPTIIAGRPARLAFFVIDDFPEASVYEALGRHTVYLEIHSKSISNERNLVYRGGSNENQRRRRLWGAVPVELILDNSDFSYVVTVPPRTVNTAIRTTRAVLVIPLTVGLLFAFLLTTLLSNRMYRPVTQLVKIFNHHPSGDWHSDNRSGKQSADQRDNQVDEIAFVLRSSDELMVLLSRLRTSLRLIAPFAAEDILGRALIGGEPEAVASLENLPGWFLSDTREIRFMVALISISSPQTDAQLSQPTEELRRILSALLISGRAFLVHINLGLFAVLFIESPEEERSLDDRLIREAITVVMERHEGLKICAGCSSYYDDLFELQRVFVRAREAHAAAYYSGSVIGTEEMVRTQRPSVSVEDETRFVNYVMAGDEANGLPIIAGLFVDAGSKPGGVIQASSLILRAAKAIGAGEERAQKLLVRAMSQAGGESDRAVIQAEVLSLADELLAAGKDASRRVDWQQLRQFVEAHSSEDLHLEGIADRLGVSARTLSYIISTHAHKTFPELLNSIRCNAACSLIRNNPHMSMSTVAKQVGYRSERTFFRQFKKTTGMRPSDLRQQARRLSF
jgi:AraC-like DNA-binding protein/uncharacterized membrane protein YqhA